MPLQRLGKKQYYLGIFFKVGAMRAILNAKGQGEILLLTLDKSQHLKERSKHTGLFKACLIFSKVMHATNYILIKAFSF